MTAALAVPADGEDRRPADIHYEVALDPEPDLAAEPVPVDVVPGRSAALLPIIPAHLQTIDGIRAAGRYHAELHWHRARYHGLRSPKYLLLSAAWAIVGTLRLAEQVRTWWWASEQAPLRSEAVMAGDSREYMKLHKQAKADRQFRGIVVASCAVALTAGCAALAVLAPWWAQAAAGAAALPLLARAGRPADRPIISAAVVEARFRKLSADIVLRAYYAAGLGHPEKPDQQIGFGGPMARDFTGEGSHVLIDLPYGKTLKDAVDARDKIASGLDVQTSQVFIHRDPSSTRRHQLWVADRDPLAVPVGRTPLLAGKPSDIWKAAPIGLNERGQLVSVPVLWNSILVGALPRQGKTFAARLLALYCALDPYCQLGVFDGKGSPDWRGFAKVAEAFSFGLTRTRYGLPAEILLEYLRAIQADVQDRYNRLSELPLDVCPKGKLTRDIARDPKYKMPVRVVILDEFQEYYELGDISKEIAKLIAFLVKVAPGAGVSLIGSTQKPSGIGGGGNTGTLFTSARDNFAVRFSLRTSSWQVSEMVLGQGAYSEGLDSSTLLPQYKGVGILRGATDESPTVRTYLADGQDADAILNVARALRERAGTLTGMAAGEEAAAEAPSSILADVVAVLGEQNGLPWEVLAGLLAKRFPDRHGDVTAESVSAECRAAGVPSVDVKHLGRALKGCRRADVLAAAGRAGGQ